jgi:hypothetical protein
MSKYGIKISEDGIGVKVANVQQTNYSSLWANLKVYRVLSVDVAVSAGTPNGSGTVANPLSYPPFFIAYISKGGSNSIYRMANQTDLAITWEEDPNLQGVVVEYDTANNRFDVSVSSAGLSSTTYNFRIVVFIDKVSGAPASVSSGGSQGVRVSNTDKDVVTGADTDMSMSSEFKNLTVNLAGTANVVYSGAGTAYNGGVSHSLGYVPIFICWFNPTGDATWGGRYLNVPTTNSFNAVLQNVEAFISTSALNFQTDHTAPSEKFRYLIFNERLV